MYVIVLSILLIKIVFKSFLDAKASKNDKKQVTYEKLGIKIHKNSKLKNEENVHSSDRKINDSSNKDDLYLMKLNRALFLCKSIEYSDEKHIKNVNLYRTIKLNARQLYMTYKVAIIRLILIFIMFRMVVYIYASVDDPKLET